MKTKLNILTLAFILLCGAKGIAQSNFTGSWDINKSKSEFGKAPAFTMPVTIIMRQSADSLALTFKGTDAEGKPSTQSRTYKLNGQEIVVKHPDTIKVAMKWAPDHQGFIRTLVFLNDQGHTVEKIRETWSVSADGKHLVIEQVQQLFNSPEEDYPITAVFDKQ